MPSERLQKIIARSGMCSRRHAEDLIREGRVVVNGKVAGLGDRADVEVDHVKVDGKRLTSAEPKRYLLLFKPREVMTTCSDPEERTTVLDLVKPAVRERVFPVGRLDYHSEGLLILTNDGELAARILHPRHGLVREYQVKIRGDLSDGELERLMRGTKISGRRVVPRRAIRVGVDHSGDKSWWRIEVVEGRTHEVRDLFLRVGHRVQRLKRTAIGPLRDDSMRSGEFRFLNDAEVGLLRKSVGLGGQGRAGRSRGADRGQG